MPLEPARTVAELEELRELTGDENGAQRVAWTDTWERRASGCAGSSPAPARARRSTRRETSGSRCGARSDRALLIGGHLDSVPNGGWLDGCLNVLAGVEVLRRIAEEGEPPVTVRLVNWADEEGARFGRSLFGSSAAAGSMRDQDELREADRPRRHRAAGRARASTASTSTARSRRASQLEERGRLSRAAHRAGAGARVAGPAARRRARHVRRRALALHLARPGRARRLDADGQAPRRARRRGEARALHPRDRGARSAAARCAPRAASSAKPGIVTSVVETAEQLLDQRHLDAGSLARMLALAREAARALRRRGEHRGRVGADLEHRADPLRRDADRLRRRGDARGRRARRTGCRRARCTTPPRSRARASRR